MTYILKVQGTYRRWPALITPLPPGEGQLLYYSYHICPQGELPRRPAQPWAQSSGSDAGAILFEPAIIDDSVFQGHPKPLVREVQLKT